MTAPAPRRSAGASAPLRVLFVCTANISRSPYAERRARQALTEWNVEFASAGIPGLPGRPLDPEMARLLRERGGDVEGHLSRSVDEEILRDADLIVPFEFGQHMKLVDAHGSHASRILGFGQVATAAQRLLAQGRPLPSVDDLGSLTKAVLLAAGPNSMSFNIDDPYGRGPRAAAECADAIDRGLDAVLPWLAGAEIAPLREGAEEEPSRRRRWPW